MQQHPDKTDLRDQLITYLLGYGDRTNKDFEELLANIFSPVLKQEIMTSGTGFLAVAAREAAASARKEAQEEAKKAAEKAAKKAKLEIERVRDEAQKTKEEAQKTKEEALTLKTRLTVMHSWHRGLSVDLISDIAQLAHNETRQLIATFEKVKTYCGVKTDVDVSELVKLSSLSEFEVKYVLTLLQTS